MIEMVIGDFFTYLIQWLLNVVKGDEYIATVVKSNVLRFQNTGNPYR